MDVRDFQTLLKQPLRITNFSGVSFLLTHAGRVERVGRVGRVTILTSTPKSCFYRAFQIERNKKVQNVG